MENRENNLSNKIESFEKPSVEMLQSGNIRNDSSSADIKKDLAKGRFEIGYQAIESAVPDQDKIKMYAFPHPRQWISPRVFAIWIFPILFIKQITRFLRSIYIYLCE